MSEIEIKKKNILNELRGLCAHCSTNSAMQHNCPVRQIALRIQSLRGVPLIVNSQFRGVLFPQI